MNFLRIFYTTSVATLLAAASMYAGGTQHCGCNPCKKTPIASFEKCLKDIRGTACVTSIIRNNGGPIIGATVVPQRGGETFSIQNVIINDTNIAPLLNGIFCSGCCPASTNGPSTCCVAAARVIELQFDVVFTCPCDSEPTVVLTLEDSAGALGTNTAILNSVASIVNNVTPFGFTANIFFSVYGLNDTEIYNLVAALLNPAVQPCINFIAQCK